MKIKGRLEFDECFKNTLAQMQTIHIIRDMNEITITTMFRLRKVDDNHYDFIFFDGQEEVVVLCLDAIEKELLFTSLGMIK